MKRIKIQKLSNEQFQNLNIKDWSSWSCEPSVFNWEYTEDETAFIFEGKVLVKTDTEEVTIQAGDLVEFPSGLKCTWNVIETVRKVYKMG
jgi:uncharacterized cupin superfamily protein